MTVRTADRPPLEQEDRPRDDREHHERDEYANRDRRLTDQPKDSSVFGPRPTLRLQLQGKGEASERVQTDLRDIAGAPLGQRRRGRRPRLDVRDCIMP